jgi:hypothetical protein
VAGADDRSVRLTRGRRARGSEVGFPRAMGSWGRLVGAAGIGQDPCVGSATLKGAW